MKVTFEFDGFEEATEAKQCMHARDAFHAVSNLRDAIRNIISQYEDGFIKTDEDLLRHLHLALEESHEDFPIIDELWS